MKATALPQDDWCPWQYGSARCSELTIEQMFGRLRRSQSNAQLSAMQFWDASQKEMAAASQKLFQENDKLKEIAKEPPLSEGQFLALTCLHFPTH